MQEVKVKISKKTGKLTIDCDGFLGEQCADIENIEEMLGTVTKHENKEERFQYEIPVPAQQGTSG